MHGYMSISQCMRMHAKLRNCLERPPSAQSPMWIDFELLCVNGVCLGWSEQHDSHRELSMPVIHLRVAMVSIYYCVYVSRSENEETLVVLRVHSRVRTQVLAYFLYMSACADVRTCSATIMLVCAAVHSYVDILWVPSAHFISYIIRKRKAVVPTSDF